MVYEIRAGLKSFKSEGIGVFVRKVGVYFLHLFCGLKLAIKVRRDFPDVSASVDYSMYTAGGVIRPGQVKSEIVHLATLVREARPSVVVEIGTAMGGTLFLWCNHAAANATVISIDLPNGIHGGGYPFWKTLLYRRFARHGQRVHLLRGDSHSDEMFECLKAVLQGRPIDFLFIDGDHTYEGVKKDYERYSCLVRPGGLIALHDVAVHPPEQHCEVDRFWAELKAGRDYQEFIADPLQGWAGIGVIKAG